MKFLLTTWGSYGDLHPFLSLARELQQRGHEVALATMAVWEAKVREAGIPYINTGGPASFDHLNLNPDLFSTKAMGLTSVRVLMRENVAPTFADSAKALLEAAPSFDCLVAHSFALVAPVVVEKTGIPLISVSLAPGVIPSAYSMPAGAYLRPFRGIVGRWINRGVWTLGRAVIASVVDPLVNEFRATHGLKPLRDAMFMSPSDELHLQLYSSAYAPREPDWPASLVQTGFCFWDEDDLWTPPVELQQFLDAGEKPLLFTLGSSAVFFPENFYEEAVRMLERTGRRAVLLLGRDENRPQITSKNVFVLNYAPYTWIMPRCSAVAHQCGIGTISHVLRAGLPSILCPYAFDQPNNAMRVQTLGAGVLLKRHRRSARDFEEAIQKLDADPSYRKNARRIAERLSLENGPMGAVDRLERFAGKKNALNSVAKTAVA